MAATAFIGFLLISAGPLLVVWCSFIAQKSFLVLLALASAFYWLITLLITALLFRAFVPLPENAAAYAAALVVAVLVQEASRFFAFQIHRQIVQQLHLASQHLRLPKVTLEDNRLLALAQGMGHALAQNAFLYYSYLPLAAGQGTKYIQACPQMSYFLAAGLLSLAFFLLHCFSMVVAFHGYERNSLPIVGAVGVLHLTASLTTVIGMANRGCVVVIWLTMAQGLLATVAAALISHKQSQNSYQVPFQDVQAPDPNNSNL